MFFVLFVILLCDIKSQNYTKKKKSQQNKYFSQSYTVAKLANNIKCYFSKANVLCVFLILVQ